MGNARRRSSRGVSRRQFLRTSGLAAGGLVIAPSLLAACGDDDSDSAASETTGGGSGGGATTKTLNVSNWPFYIDPTEDGATGSVDLFRESSGIDVAYTEDINDNNEYFAEISPVLSAGDKLDADIIVLTDWMAGRLINSLQWVEELDKSMLPNVEANLVDSLREVAFDPGRRFSVPWQSGMTGIGYRRDLVGGDLTSVNDLFNPDFAGQVTMLTEMRDTVGLVALGMGIDPATITFDEARPVFDKIQGAASDGQLRRFTGNDYGDDLLTGNVVAAIAWSGDVVQLQLENPEIQLVIPDEGGMLWSDNMMIPVGAENVEAAHEWIDYFYDPVNAARVASWVQFIPPVKGVKEELAKIDEESANNPLIVPPDELAARLSVFNLLTEDEEALFDERFNEIVNA